MAHDEANPKQERHRCVDRVDDVLRSYMDEPLTPQLYLVATPIGHLADMSLRALAVLARTDVIAVEDTRRSRTLLQHYGISSELITYHDHNGDQMRPKIIAMIKAGKSVALISDAGMPLISDPGYKLVGQVREAGLTVEVVPGASAVMAGLSLSGLPTDRFLFEGFLPPKQQARRRQLAALSSVKASLVFYETVKRVQAVLIDMQSELGDRRAALCRELTKLHQEIIEGSISELIELLETRDLKGELVIVVAPPQEQTISDAQIEDALTQEVAKGASMRDAVAHVVETFEAPKKHVYDLSVQLKKRQRD